jgi:hypothetical protein
VQGNHTLCLLEAIRLEIVFPEEGIKISAIFSCQVCSLAHVTLRHLEDPIQVVPFKVLLGLLERLW